MKKRRSNRFLVGLAGEVVFRDTKHAAYIGNISEDGLYALISPLDIVTDEPPVEEIGVRCQIAPGRMLNLRCREIWSCKFLPERSTVKMGMQIIDPPEMYREFLNTLNNFENLANNR